MRTWLNLGVSKLGIVIHAHKYDLHIDLHIEVGLTNNVNTKKSTGVY